MQELLRGPVDIWHTWEPEQNKPNLVASSKKGWETFAWSGLGDSLVH